MYNYILRERIEAMIDKHNGMTESDNHSYSVSFKESKDSRVFNSFTFRTAVDWFNVEYRDFKKSLMGYGLDEETADKATFEYMQSLLM